MGYIGISGQYHQNSEYPADTHVAQPPPVPASGGEQQPGVVQRIPPILGLPAKPKPPLVGVAHV